MFEIKFKKRALRFFSKLNKSDQEIIGKKIMDLSIIQ